MLSSTSRTSLVAKSFSGFEKVFSSNSHLFHFSFNFFLFYALIRAVATVFLSNQSFWISVCGSILDVVSLGIGLLCSLYFYLVFAFSRIRFPRRVFVFLFGFTFFILFSCLNDSCIPSLIDGDAYTLAVRCLPSFFAMVCVQDWKRLFESITKAAPVLLICSIIIISQADLAQSDYMGVSSALIIPTVFAFISTFFKGIRSWSCIAAVCGFIAILIAGSRGSLFSVAIAVLICGVYYFVKNTNKKPNTIIIACVVICFLLFVCIQFDSILQWLVGVFPDSRTLLLILEGEAFDGGTALSRQYAWEACMQLVLSNPLMPLGAFADRPVVFGTWASSYSTYAGTNPFDTYVHNMCIEILVNFGMILGIFLLALFLYLVIVAFVRTHKIQLPMMILIGLVVSELCRLQISGSWLIDPMAWMMIAAVLMFSCKNYVENVVKGGL